MNPSRSVKIITPENCATLRTLWSEGHSTAEIGRRMGWTKNAVIGKAHRMHLPGRPSPLPDKDRPPSPLPEPTLPRYPKATLALLQPAAPQPPAPAAPTVQAAPAAPAAPVVRPTRFLPRKGGACCWPLGDPGEPGFRFCDAGSKPGKPYCEQHVAVAYTKRAA